MFAKKFELIILKFDQIVHIFASLIWENCHNSPHCSTNLGFTIPKVNANLIFQTEDKLK